LQVSWLEGGGARSGQGGSDRIAARSLHEFRLRPPRGRRRRPTLLGDSTPFKSGLLNRRTLRPILTVLPGKGASDRRVRLLDGNAFAPPRGGSILRHADSETIKSRRRSTLPLVRRRTSSMRDGLLASFLRQARRLPEGIFEVKHLVTMITSEGASWRRISKTIDGKNERAIFELFIGPP
jgi:hypothetical protein